MTQLVVLLPAGPAGASAPGAVTMLGAPRIRVLSIRGNVGWDLTDFAEGLVWSSRDPGGDERCAFRLKRSWFAGAPEIAQGNRLVVTDGPETLWQGRIEDNDRAVTNVEEIGVGAYGSGKPLGDSSFADVFVDQDLSHWGEQSGKRRQDNLTGGFATASFGSYARDDTARPGLFLSTIGPLLKLSAEIWYDAGQLCEIGRLYCGDLRLVNMGPTETHLSVVANSSSSDAAADNVATVELKANPSFDWGADDSPANPGQRFVWLQWAWDSGGAGPLGTEGTEYGVSFRNIAVYGDHGLTPKGTADATNVQGFTVDQIVPYIVAKVPGVVARRIDATTYVIRQLEFREPVAHDAAIAKTSEVELCNWGTFGSDDIFDRSSNGYLDWKLRDPVTAHWFATRADCDDIDLHVELADLYDQVDVNYQDAAGTKFVESRTAYIEALALADPPIHKVKTINGGLLTQADAQQLGDLDLATSSGRTPARGTITPFRVTHHRRGKLGPWHMRAGDGSNIRVPDVLPARDVFDLSSAADRKTTFPINRVEVDCSDKYPRVSVEVDQALDAVSVAGARFAQNALNIGG